ncbi:Ovate protein family, C-terminal [Artemisia annua]|uniref:Transcription repressor n=1 Tax=Artemisia annua TaxID=35608 RepID=A0A2U1KX77_ARTAN|nr:Ovate protein family, C-terminal [Artemisia annua]
MGRKLPFLPTCGSPSKTLSFRAVMTASAITDDLDDKGMTQETESSIDPSKTLSFRAVMTASAITDDLDDKGMTQETESSIESENVSMMEMESIDPYVDFKKSMQEMVEADEGLKQWDNLQELLSMYLSLNDKINHGYIIRAFVDILLILDIVYPMPVSCLISLIDKLIMLLPPFFIMMLFLKGNILDKYVTQNTSLHDTTSLQIVLLGKTK